jgi:hypothetical protein
MPIGFRRIRSTSSDVVQLQDSVANALNPIIKKEIIDGQLLENLALATSQDNLIQHKLGRNLRGYIIVRKNALADVYEQPVPNNLTELQLNLHTTQTVTISLWVF